MSNPTIVNVVPAPNARDVVLGSSIIVTFSEPIDVDSYNNATFALTGPNRTSIITPTQLIEIQPEPSQGSGYVLGEFGFSTLTYSPWQPFTNYNVGIQVVDSNGNVETVTETGKSAPYQPTWTTETGQTTVDNNLPGWQALQQLPFGQYILDPNSNLQKVTVSIGGSTGPVMPSWNTTLNGITFDGSITWTNYGPFNPVIWMNGGMANNGQTVATFTPSKPLIPGEIYTVLIVGSDSTLASSFVHDLSGNNLLNSYQWSFTSGTLPLPVPPVQNPLSNLVTTLRPDQVQIIPRSPVGVDDPSVSNISIIDLIFPAVIDVNSYQPSGVLVGVEPIMNDPDVMVPFGASASYVVQGNKMIVTVVGV